jgi:hypothetical protein
MAFIIGHVNKGTIVPTLRTIDIYGEINIEEIHAYLLRTHHVTADLCGRTPPDTLPDQRALFACTSAVRISLVLS